MKKTSFAKRTRLASSVLLALSVGAIGCSTSKVEENSAPRAPTGRQCVDNFTMEGSFWTGRTSKTHQDFAGVSKGEAFDRLLAKVASNGYQVNSSSKDAGLISASQGVTGSSKTTPLNVVISDQPGGQVRVALVFVTSGGLAFSREGLEKEFCEILASVQGG